MVKKIRVSRQGLTRCPSCKNHIKVAAPINKTICSFCETSLAESLGTDTGELILGTRKVSGGSRALLAATILGLPMAACGTEEPVANDIVADVIEEDNPVVALYGLPMDMIEPPIEDVIEESDEGMPVALYGMPPAEDAGFSEDDVSDVEASDEGMPVALYGMPPAEDAGSSDDEGADVEETDDMPNMALYGLPPNDKEPS